MDSTRQAIPVGPRRRRVDRAAWVPTLGPGMVLGAISTVGLVISMFMSWRTTNVHPSGIPLAFLFDNATTAKDPSILLALIPMAVLLGVGSVMPLASAARIVGGIGALAVVVAFAVQLNRQVDHFPGASVWDVLDPGLYVAAIAGFIGLVSGFMPSGWRGRTVSAIDDGVVYDDRV
jgi:hypothetical protein